MEGLIFGILRYAVFCLLVSSVFPSILNAVLSIKSLGDNIFVWMCIVSLFEFSFVILSPSRTILASIY